MLISYCDKGAISLLSFVAAIVISFVSWVIYSRLLVINQEVVFEVGE